MKKTVLKNLFRDIKKTFSRFLSIVIIITVGVSFYAGVRATSPDMKKSGDYYFYKNNLMDFKVISTLGITKDDIAEIEKLNGVTKADGSYSMDGVVEKDNRSIVLNVNSLPKEDSMNKINILKGRTAKNDREAVVEEKFLEKYKSKIGDKIVLQSDNDSDIKDKLKNNEFQIVGTAESPLYISAQRQLSSVGDGDVNGFVYIIPEDFKSDVYTEMYVRCNSEESKASLLSNDKYKNVTSGIEKELEGIGIKRNEIRYAQVLRDANDKIQAAEDKLGNSRREAEDKIAEGHRQLDDAKVKLEQGKSEFQENQISFDKKISYGEKQISQGKSQIEAAENEINSNTVDIQNGRLQLAKAKNQLTEAENKLNAGKQQAAASISEGMEVKVAEAKKYMDSLPINPVYIAQYNSLNEIYEKDIKGKDFDNMYDALNNDGAVKQLNEYFDIKSLKITFDKAYLDISSGRKQITAKNKLLQDGEARLAAGRAEIEENKKKIADSERELNKEKKEGIIKLNDANAQLVEGQKIIDENTQRLNSEESKTNSQINSGEAQLQRNRDKIKNIKKPEWYVLGRTLNVGYENYRQDSHRIDNIGKAFPLIFFLVAALVSLTTMARMVQENRIEIGTFKALGYSRLAIVSHYLIYSLLASVIGSVIGISFGFRLFPPLIMNAYSSLYTIPYALIPFNTKLAVESSLIAVLFTSLAAIAATLSELREVPASLMRPKPPKSGKVILLEKITFLWKRLSFTRKVTARNIFRYKQRFFMTVIGIAACTGLMITGFGLKEGITGAMNKQFSEIYKYNMQASFIKSIDSGEKNNIKNKIIKDNNMKSILFTYSKNASVNKKSGSEDVYIIVPENKGNLNKYINLTMKNNSLKLEDNGVIITEKLSKLINKKIGDSFQITINSKVINAKISAITEQYVQHYIYISSDYYKKIAGEDIQFNSFYGLLKDTSNSAQNNTSKILTDIDGIGSVSFKNNLQVNFNKGINSINSVVLVLIVSAGILAFVVIYNLTNININERKRELATIKVLGFYNNELAFYIYRENIILTIIGSLVGIIYGILINRLIISTAETNVMMFLKTINPIYLLYSAMLTILFSFVVNLVMYRRFDRIDMIESLKNAE
ncbi:ABC transporter permease [Clostridium pasteurianum]|uniref:ABC-type transport system, involved in lipoprotein release, permease component n=1 Tax=Clostridium pasteurianum BC1 TaxID=86416 RepID=R4KFL3_CLOPA|nr:ABC transporter permease [Clostridium pasteurianum]AGK98400.1 ABC-type transport system, involved in lipoprotein release, permease component [Clostridium pasteurianum BC1]